MLNARLEELRSKFQENPRRYFAPFANELRKSGDLPQAISVCRAHLASQPGHVSGHIVLGQALYEAGESDEARGIFTAALELDPENLIALRSLGEIAQVNGEFAAARQWYERLLDADPRNTEVSQLLRDIPTAAAPAVIDPLPDVEEIPRPDQREEEQVVEPAPAPRFHTTFSGSGPAYKSRDEESASEDRTQESAEPVSAAAESADEKPAETEPVTMGASAEPAEAIDLLDAENFHADAQPQAELPQTPDESLETFAFHASGENDQVGFQNGDYSKTAEFEEELHIPEPAPQAEQESEQVAEAESSTEPTEPVRAFFAERGFDGPADDQIGWMTTPSASLSDLESAPEDWYDESATAKAEQGEGVAAESPAEEPNAVEASASDPSVDSWFDDVEGAAVIEATEVTNDEFWLPPELPTTVQPATATPEPAPEFVAEMPSTETAEENDFLSEPSALPVMSSAEPPAAEEIGYTERESFEDESFTSVSSEVKSTFQPPEESTPSKWSEQLEPPFMEPYAAAEEFSPEDRAESDVYHAADATSEDAAQVSMGSVAEEPIQAAAEGWTEPEGEAAPEPIQATAEGWTEPESEPHHEPFASEHWSEAAAETPSEPIHADGWSEPAGEPPNEPLDVPATWTESADETPLEPIHAAEGWTDTAGEAPHEPVPTMGLTPAFIDAVPTTPAPFVTETLAELYLQQGFRDEALSIYRQLAERDPSDESLKARIAEIEKPAAVEEPPAPVASTWSDPTSQSVRTFFSRLARRPAVPVTAANSPAQADVSLDAPPDVPFATAASALANLFAASKPPASDEGAATTLAGAFTDPAGRPSRAAERELSLDHLFRDVPPAEQSGGGVSLDEFFATPNASPGSPTEPGEAGGPGEQGGTDIRQFTAWLEGLRKK